MFPGEQAEDAIVADVGNGNGKEGEPRGAMGVEGEREEQHGGKFTMKSLLWHGGSVWDAWFSCASNQVCICMFVLSLPRRESAGSFEANRWWRVRRWRRCC